MFFNFPRAKVELTLIARTAERGVFCDENDERVAKAKKKYSRHLRDFFGAATQTVLKISPAISLHTQTHPSF